MKRIWLFVLICMPQLVFAADIPSNPFDIKGFAPPVTDWSVGFLRQIFGHVGAALWGSQQTILGQLFGIFNAGIISVVAMFLIYTTVRSIIDTAQDGEIMGKKLSHWTAIRTAVGLGVLVPKFSGYSFIQVFVMWTVIQGVGLADHAWNTALDYLKAGGAIYTTPATIAKTDQIDTKLINPQNKYAGSTDAMRSLVCMESLNYLYQQKQEAKKQQILKHPENYPPKGSVKYTQMMSTLDSDPPFTVAYDEANHTATFPGKVSGYEQLAGVCGAYSWKVAGAATSQGDKNYNDAKEAGIKQMVLDLAPLAKSIVNQAVKGPIDTGNAANHLVSAALDYQTIIYPARFQTSKVHQHEVSGFYDNAVAQGWSMAGRYYRDLSQINDVASLEDKQYQIAVTVYPPGNVPADSSSKGVSTDGRQTSYNKLEQQVTKFFGDTVGLDAIAAALRLTDKAGVAAKEVAEYTNSNTHSEDNAKIGDLNNSGFAGFQSHGSFSNDFKAPRLADIMSAILSVKMGYVVDSWYSNMVDSKSDNLSPIVKLQQVGNSMINNAGEFWTTALATLYTSATAMIVADTTVASVASVTASATGGGMEGIGISLVNAINAFLPVIGAGLKALELFTVTSLPVCLAVTSFMFTLGITLGVYVPLIPFMLFTFGVISWLIFVIEAMAAAPLVALGITHPEGHDLLGKAEQALMLLFSVFLRPICMIIGLIAAIVLARVALTVLNAGFGGILSDTGIISSGPSAFSLGDVFKNLAVLIVYTMIVLALVNQCFGMIYIIPEKVMRWLGMHPEGSDIPHMMESVKGGATQFADSMGRGAGDSSTGAAKSVGEASSRLGAGHQARGGAQALKNLGKGIKNKFSGSAAVEKK